MFLSLIGHKSLDLHKIGFLYAGNGRWHLAPAHGLRPAGSRPETTLVGAFARRTPSLTLDALMESSEAFEVNRSSAQARRSLQLSVISGWKKLAVEFSINMRANDMKLFEHGPHELPCC